MLCEKERGRKAGTYDYCGVLSFEQSLDLVSAY
jgi:hypothetical protein